MIPTETPQFTFGSEKLFFKYIKSLGDAKKIALISHTDLDGIASAKIVNKVVQADNVYFKDYDELTPSLANEFNREKFSHMIFTDIFLKGDQFLPLISKKTNILIIDHHYPEKDLNSPEITFMNAQHFCAAFLSYYLFNKTQDLMRLEWLAAVASLADITFKSIPNWMADMAIKYNSVYNPSRPYDNIFGKIQATLSLALIYFGKDIFKVYHEIKDNFQDFSSLEPEANEVQREIDLYKSKFEKEKVPINDGYFFELSPKFGIKSILVSEISFSCPDKTLIFAKPIQEKGIYTLSARRQDSKVSMNDLLKSLVEGIKGAGAGGHIPAAGGHCLLKDKDEVKRRLGIIK